MTDSIVGGSAAATVDDGPVADAGVETTGDARVDAAVELLRGLDEQPVSAHAEVFEDVHRRLHEALTALDED